MPLERSSLRSCIVFSESSPITLQTSASLTPCSFRATSSTIRPLMYLLITAVPASLCCHQHTRTHRGTNRNRPDVHALYPVRLDRVDVVKKGIDVFRQLLGIETDLADHGMDNPAVVVAEF